MWGFIIMFYIISTPLQFCLLCTFFVQIFKTSLTDMIEDLENGDVAETVALFFDKSRNVLPSKKSVLTVHQVE